jgi:hypothetical protein
MCYFLFLVTDNGNLDDEAKVKKCLELMFTMMNGAIEFPAPRQ